MKAENFEKPTSWQHQRETQSHARHYHTLHNLTHTLFKGPHDLQPTKTPERGIKSYRFNTLLTTHVFHAPIDHPEVGGAQLVKSRRAQKIKNEGATFGKVSSKSGNWFFLHASHRQSKKQRSQLIKNGHLRREKIFAHVKNVKQKRKKYGNENLGKSAQNPETDFSCTRHTANPRNKDRTWFKMATCDAKKFLFT